MNNDATLRDENECWSFPTRLGFETRVNTRNRQTRYHVPKNQMQNTQFKNQPTSSGKTQQRRYCE